MRSKQDVEPLHRKCILNLRSVRLAAAGLLFACLSAPTFAEYAAIAYGDETKTWGWARKADQRTANRQALAGCMKNSKSKDCKLDITVAIGRADGENRVGWGRSSKSLADARKNAIESCGDSDCKVTFETIDPGFYSLAKTKNNEGKDGTFHLYYNTVNSDQADKDAIEACAERSGRECSVVWSGAIPGNIDVGTKPSKPMAATPAAKNCRPNTPTMRCFSQCTNGNCVITYENGCKMNVQVQPTFDPFTNQWNYPAPSC